MTDIPVELERLRVLARELLSGEATKGFYQQARSYYHRPEHNGEDFIDSLTLGIYHFEGGTSGEFTIEWTRLDRHVVSRMKAFDDSWDIFPLIPDLFKLMAEVSSSSDSFSLPCEVFAKRLIEMGWRDLTRVMPGRGDGFERTASYGEIPHAMRPLFSPWTHYASAQSIDEDWLVNLEGRGEWQDGVLFLDNERDAVLTHLRFS